MVECGAEGLEVCEKGFGGWGEVQHEALWPSAILPAMGQRYIGVPDWFDAGGDAVSIDPEVAAELLVAEDLETCEKGFGG